jgi:hypothetical protein
MYRFTRCFVIVLGLVIGIAAGRVLPASAQTSTRPRPNDVQAELAKNPELTSGFTTQDGTKARVVRAVGAGVLIEAMHRNGSQETITFTGPPSVMTRSSIENLVIMLARAGAFTPTAGKPQKCETSVTVTQHSDGSTTTSVTRKCSPA